MKDTAGNVKRSVGIKRDVSAQKQSEEAAMHLVAIVESSDDAIVSKDLNGIVRSWNAGAERIFGYTADEMIGQSILTILPPERHHEEQLVLNRVRAGERVQHFETVRRRKDGSDIHVSLTISPIKNSAGQIVGASKIARDITDRITAEEAVRQSLAIKDQFLSLISHELRTPVATILGNGVLLLKRGQRLQEEDKQQAFADIVTESEKLHENIEHLLLLTRLGTGELELEPLSLGVLVSSQIVSFKGRHPDRVIAFKSEGEAPPGLGEETLIALVIQNLLSNANKYSPPEAPIQVLLTATPEGGPEVRVRDYGIGLDQHDLENLFTAFYRSPKAKANASGLGLGLAVCERALVSQGGSIAAENRPDGGSDFFFSLRPAEQQLIE